MECDDKDVDSVDADDDNGIHLVGDCGKGGWVSDLLTGPDAAGNNLRRGSCRAL